jgi:hypothetical protein
MSLHFSSEIAVAQLADLIGLPDCPILIDVRIADDFRAGPRLSRGCSMTI